ncbi:hypothetical protein [Alteribacillus persepolensis]|nr:hypothetical protein [Alteribacillus persepolensis]
MSTATYKAEKRWMVQLDIIESLHYFNIMNAYWITNQNEPEYCYVRAFVPFNAHAPFESYSPRKGETKELVFHTWACHRDAIMRAKNIDIDEAAKELSHARDQEKAVLMKVYKEEADEFACTKVDEYLKVEVST